MIALLALQLALLGAEPCGKAALDEAGAADRRLRVEGTCASADLERLRAGIRALDSCRAATATTPEQRFLFPIEGQRAERSLGGGGGKSGYVAAKPKKCFAIRDPGHPAHDLFVPDPDQDSKDARGDPFQVRAVADGAVLAIKTEWTPDDPGKGGNYVVLYLPARKALAYYAHLSTVSVAPGQKVARGERLGTVGRTGVNAAKKRSPTHLHFALWDQESLAPIDPYRLLMHAEASP